MPKKSQIYMGTTEVDAIQTAGEIQAMLAKKGATDIATQYKDGEIVGMSFLFDVNGRSAHFEMPARVEPVYQILRKSRTRYSRNGERVDRAQAKRTAWRLIKRWVESQMAMIETGMVTLPEVFTPYMVTGNGGTVWQQIEATKFKALPMEAEAE